ncbi:MAG TPA: flavodoxin-dependent (E)-4-hydroxy-3-methylbut-2-enyl-diphosphate synthase [Thermotogota bacterium]|nr:flavodoxin-dependent (E)-4-hydroxy-3-methylbut-2-enyl-diphosphate synthase [Thermotogota bacterium]
MRRKTKAVWVGPLQIGGDAPVSIQSMTNTDTRDVLATVQQIEQLGDAGCDLVRLSVFDAECVRVLPSILEQVQPLPLVADIHFDARLAIGAIHAGVKKVRINPGNIASQKDVSRLARVASENGVCIRVGANSGSIHPDFCNLPRVDALVESALRQVRQLEKQGFSSIVVGVKSSDARETVAANQKVARMVDYPLHLGVTEAGPLFHALIKSSFALGSLLDQGIGDTVRISISGDPVEEVRAAQILLKTLGLRQGVTLISCPTCGRARIDVAALARQVESWCAHVSADVTVAVMGCEVNGLGEGREADLGIAGLANGGAVLFQRGKVLGTYSRETIKDAFFQALREMEKRGWKEETR